MQLCEREAGHWWRTASVIIKTCPGSTLFFYCRFLFSQTFCANAFVQEHIVLLAPEKCRFRGFLRFFFFFFARFRNSLASNSTQTLFIVCGKRWFCDIANLASVTGSGRLVLVCVTCIFDQTTCHLFPCNSFLLLVSSPLSVGCTAGLEEATRTPGIVCGKTRGTWEN